ncbi:MULTISPECIES: ribonuclease P protein component [Ectothiorhodospira]|uniref:ribonuclease P protein component n=1 Tax=Ectothiorhodospira TaxID=1051 RepID=UPI001EE8A9E2|nr:ribonuclease P protein component [Ectothiorhodospira haloalkaliphila]MCG5495002.1 ribonuclease P protein component [Ectothiorhodospira variabilis]MCG5496345.1 ribonuclease P protein component [Ectothiorhodospira variabilis]MCG5504515.1 ribonuclease P protein component [Ectothiorhodospira variabilis]MCG5525817.1 ribonuclease P protein component [Ectothiorhodospira haloalkaliphila]
MAAAKCWLRAAPKAAPVSAPDPLARPAGRLADRGFPRAARLTCASDYQQVFAGAHRVSEAPFTGLWRHHPSDAPQTARLGMAVAKRNVRLATQRNRIKRLIRESFRHHRDSLGAIDIVVLCKPRAERYSNEQLREALDRLWQRMSIQCERSSSS